MMIYWKRNNSAPFSNKGYQMDGQFTNGNDKGYYKKIK
jgi:hypothetical protein